MLVIKGGTVIDGKGGDPLTDGSVVIEGRRIQQVGPSKTVVPPKDATIIDATGKFVIPGLIDSHVHYRDYMPQLFLNHGITSVKDVGNIPEWIVAQRQGIHQGNIPGPRIFVAGRFGAIKGFPADIDPPGAYPPSEKISNADEAAGFVKYLLSFNVDQIKVLYGFPPALLSVIATETHNAGLYVTSHVTISARDAASSGVDGLEHGSGIVQALLGESEMEKIYKASSMEQRTTSAFHLMKKENFKDLAKFLVDKGTRIIPTFVLWAIAGGKRRDQYDFETLSLLKRQELAYIPQGRYFWWLRDNQYFWINRPSLGENAETRLRNLQEGYKKYQDFIAMFADSGGRLVAGTDTGFMIPALSMHHELQEMVDAGISPMATIVSATSKGAEFLGPNGKEVGAIEKGKYADLVVLNGNPLKEIAQTKNIALVVKDGKLQDLSYDPCFTNPLPSPRKIETHAHRVPIVTTVSPFVVTEGPKEAVDIQVVGSFFTRFAAVKINAARIPTKFISPSELRAVIPASYLGRPGTLPLTVENPPPEGGESIPVYVMVIFKQ